MGRPPARRGDIEASKVGDPPESAVSIFSYSGDTLRWQDTLGSKWREGVGQILVQEVTITSIQVKL